MEAGQAVSLTEIVAFLVTAVVVVLVCRLARVSPVLGFLVTGAVIGPFGLKVVADAEKVRGLAELGVAFLLFTIGLELSLERLKALRRLVFGLGAAQVAVTAVAIGLIAHAWGNPPKVALILGLALALSSTAMVMQLLMERGEITTRHGRAGFAVLLFQDLAVMPVLLLVAAIGGQGGGPLLAELGLALAQAVAAVLVILVLGRLLLRPLFHMVAWARSREIFMAMTLLAVLIAAWGTFSAGLTMALGPFLAGLLLAETEYRHQIESDIQPFRGLLLGLFFISVGMLLDFTVVMDRFGWIVASVLGLVALKAAIATALCRAFGLPWDVAVRTGLVLGPGGEFAFVIIGQAAQGFQIIAPDVAQFMVIVAAASMVLTPALPWAGTRLARLAGREDRHAPADPPLHDLEGHVVIAGYGRVGHAVAALLRRRAIPFVALDLDLNATRRARARGEPVYYGDASRLDVLERLNVAKAAAVLVTMDNPRAGALLVEAMRRRCPDVPVIVRARDVDHARRLIALGARNVVPETFESSLQLGGRILQVAGTPAETVHQILDEIREDGYEALYELSADGKDQAPPG